MNVPTEIRDRYAAGEREIRVSPQTYQDYCEGLIVLNWHRPDWSLETHEANIARWVWYRDAKVRVQ